MDGIREVLLIVSSEVVRHQYVDAAGQSDEEAVNRDTKMVVEPTAPNAVEPANRPTTATSAILNNTCSRLEKIRGMLNRKICSPTGPL